MDNTMQNVVNDSYEGQIMDKEHEINILEEEIKSLKKKNLELLQRFEEKISISDYEKVKAEKEHYKEMYFNEKEKGEKFKNDWTNYHYGRCYECNNGYGKDDWYFHGEMNESDIDDQDIEVTDVEYSYLQKYPEKKKEGNGLCNECFSEFI